jgi:hypothetical protein
VSSMCSIRQCLFFKYLSIHSFVSEKMRIDDVCSHLGLIWKTVFLYFQVEFVEEFPIPQCCHLWSILPVSSLSPDLLKSTVEDIAEFCVDKMQKWINNKNNRLKDAKNLVGIASKALQVLIWWGVLSPVQWHWQNLVTQILLILRLTKKTTVIYINP